MLYFSVVTLTTVGYGDLSPSKAAGKVLTLLYSSSWGWASSTRWPNARSSDKARHANAGGWAGRDAPASGPSADILRTLTGNWGIGSMRGTGEGRWWRLL